MTRRKTLIPRYYAVMQYTDFMTYKPVSLLLLFRRDVDSTTQGIQSAFPNGLGHSGVRVDGGNDLIQSHLVRDSQGALCDQIGCFFDLDCRCICPVCLFTDNIYI